MMAPVPFHEFAPHMLLMNLSDKGRKITTVKATQHGITEKRVATQRVGGIDSEEDV